MPNLDIVKKHKVAKSFRVDTVRGMFDFPDTEVEHRIKVRFPYDKEPWKIGLIIGASGSGKTTVAKEEFGLDETPLEWPRNKSFLDGFRKGIKIEDITASLSSVGLSSPPDWMKPFHLLSNGQKFRAEMARRILESDSRVVIDEFTSVVDRQVAKSCSMAIEKFIRRRKEESSQLVAVSCHYDVIEYLRPDWVLDLNTNEFTRCGRMPRPKTEITIRQCDRSMWELFRKHHYLSHTIATAAKCFVAFIGDAPVGFTSYVRQPHNTVMNLMREHRTVVMPDYQGFGLGVRLSDWLANHITSNGSWRYTSVTSHPAMIGYRLRSPLWKCIRKASHVSKGSEKTSKIHKSQGSQSRLTYSFEWVGESKVRRKRNRKKRNE